MIEKEMRSEGVIGGNELSILREEWLIDIKKMTQWVC